MLTFYLADNSWISLRPSGTEPKLKAYLGVIGHADRDVYPAIKAALELKLANIKKAVKEML